ncbi:hypothetical protein ACFQ2O_06880 [Pontibacter rugosus]|uniref:Uncharacterized protein n=2 Tax=Pontibacter rugosus TaxID=1745966 RepID=A0ABW3SME4_9BACT
MQLFWEQQNPVPLWGQQSISTDLMTFSVVSGFILTWVVTKCTRQALRQNKVLPLHWHLKSQTLIDRLPSHTFNRAFILALNSVFTSALLIQLLEWKNLNFMSHADYCILFVFYGVLLTIAVTVMSFYRALGDNFLRKSNVP